MASETTTTTAEPKPRYSVREEEVIRASRLAWKALPEIDMKLLVQVAGFNTAKTAANVWGAIKKKMQEDIEAQGNGVVVKADDATKTVTPGKKKGVRAAAATVDGEPAAKKQRKSAKKSVPVVDHPGDSDTALSNIKEELAVDTKPAEASDDAGIEAGGEAASAN